MKAKEIRKLYNDVEDAREMVESTEQVYGDGHDYAFEAREALQTAEGALRVAVAYENETEAARGR